MPAPMQFHKFAKLVGQYGCFIEPSNKEWVVRTNEGGWLVSRFAVHHKKGGRREVKMVYVKQFLQRAKTMREGI